MDQMVVCNGIKFNFACNKLLQAKFTQLSVLLSFKECLSILQFMSYSLTSLIIIITLCFSCSRKAIFSKEAVTNRLYASQPTSSHSGTFRCSFQELVEAKMELKGERLLDLTLLDDEKFNSI